MAGGVKLELAELDTVLRGATVGWTVGTDVRVGAGLLARGSTVDVAVLTLLGRVVVASLALGDGC